MATLHKSYGAVNGQIVEQINGALPGLSWEDPVGVVWRAYAVKLDFDLIGRRFEIPVAVEIFAEGKWRPDRSFNLIAGDHRYQSLITGTEEYEPWEDDPQSPIIRYNHATRQNEIIGYNKKLKPGLVTQAEWFIRLVGNNEFNTMVSLYAIIRVAMAEKLGITL